MFDYDGTLTPIVARPELALLSRDTRRQLTLLSSMARFTVGVVSGRELADLESLVAIPGLVYAGNHGLEMSGAGMEYVHPSAPKFVDSLVEVGGLLEQKLAEVPGILVDNKRLTLTVHFRTTPDSYSAQVEHTVVAVTKSNVDSGQLKITRGKRLLEVSPDIDWGKGNAIERIHQNCGGSPIPVFFGDDETDEEGFAVVQHVGGIAVYIGGTRRNTKALHQLESPGEVAQVLELLTQL